jgi:hypothetical protein
MPKYMLAGSAGGRTRHQKGSREMRCFGLRGNRTSAKSSRDEQARLPGNPRCFLCRVAGILPFARCRSCDLSGANRCPTLKAGFFLLSACALTGLVAYQVHTPASQAVFIMTGLLTGAMLLLINTHSNQRNRDRLELARLHDDLEQQHEFLKELGPIGNMQDCLEYIVNSAAGRLACRRVSVMLPDETFQWLHIAAACGLPQEVVRNTRIPIGSRICGQVFQMGRPVHVRRGDEAGGRPLPAGNQAFMSVPLLLSGMRWGNVRVGVLSVTEPIDREDFSLEDEFALCNISEAAAVAIYNHMAVEKVEQAHVEFLETLVKAIEARDEYTRGHSDRVCQYALAMGQRLMLTESSLVQLRTAARLHDIGKIGIPDAILRKPARLTEEEWTIVRRHPAIAAEMLSEASVVVPAIEAIRRHHERLDGSGYPGGLKGAAIHLLARIIGVADAFDAMTSARPYRQAMSPAAALAELNRHKDTQFDPACVEAMAEVIASGQLDRQEGQMIAAG